MFTREHKRPDICCDMLQYVGTFYRVLLRYIATKRVLILLNNAIYFGKSRTHYRVFYLQEFQRNGKIKPTSNHHHHPITTATPTNSQSHTAKAKSEPTNHYANNTASTFATTTTTASTNLTSKPPPVPAFGRSTHAERRGTYNGMMSSGEFEETPVRDTVAQVSDRRLRTTRDIGDAGSHIRSEVSF